MESYEFPTEAEAAEWRARYAVEYLKELKARAKAAGIENTAIMQEKIKCAETVVETTQKEFCDIVTRTGGGKN